MFGYIKGELSYKDPTLVIVDVGGVGYELKITLNTYTAIKDQTRVKLFSYLHVKEDALTLYGFYEQKEKVSFLQLLSVSGVGPSSALMALSSLNVDELNGAIAVGDVKTIQRVKGIGAKTAQRIILELKDKIFKSDHTGKVPELEDVSHNTIREEALSALQTLGVSKVQAEKSVTAVWKKNQGSVSLEQLIKQALKAT